MKEIPSSVSEMCSGNEMGTDIHVLNKTLGISSIYLGNFIFISRLIGKCATQRLKNLRNSSLWTCSHHMAILKSGNKNAEFSMILI